MDSNNLRERYLKGKIYIGISPLIFLSSSVWFSANSIAIVLSHVFQIYLYALLCFISGFLYSQSGLYNSGTLRNLSTYPLILTIAGILLTLLYSPVIGLGSSLLGLWIMTFVQIPKKAKVFFPVWFMEFIHRINVITCICLIIMLAYWLNPYSKPLAIY